MKKESTYCTLSIVLSILGIIFTICALILQTIPDSSKSALLLLSVCLILIGVTAYAVHHKRYVLIKDLISTPSAQLAHWQYTANSSPVIQAAFKEQRASSIATAGLALILAIIFSIVLAYSGATYTLYTGYILAVLCFLIFIIAIKFINTYYTYTASVPSEAIFGETHIYFLDELYPIERAIHYVDNIIITKGEESLLNIVYGQYDIDDLPIYTLSIPIPPDKMNIALKLRTYYLELLNEEH